ncbi:MAG: hypothetical protein PHS95_00230 [Candidatus Pacebacteria bacterium]|nr:hypothetical protein [Candidatus Paceibacterota bacterium]
MKIKKYYKILIPVSMAILVIIGISLILTISGWVKLSPGCEPGDKYSPTTGLKCIPGCDVGDNFDSTTGKPCK